MTLDTSLQELRQIINQAEPTKDMKDTPYLARQGKVWGILRKYFGENWPRYNSTALCHEIPFCSIDTLRGEATSGPFY